MGKRRMLLKGTSASAGKVKGKVRIIKNLGEIGKMRKGDILGRLASHTPEKPNKLIPLSAVKLGYTLA